LNSSGAVISQLQYGYDAKGQITLWKQQTDSNPITRYDTGYDAAGQLNSAVLSTDSTNAVLHQYYYNYDAAANRTSEQMDGAVTGTSVNNLNQITGEGAGGTTRFQGTLSAPGTVQVNGQTAAMPTSTNFVANPSLNSGTNTVAVVATNGGGSQTNTYQVVLPSGTSVAPQYDLAGNMINNGNGQTYQWDAENRLIQITQGSSVTQFTYDGLGRRVSETDNGTLAKQWVWVSSVMAEERDATGTNVTKRFFPQGEQIGGTAYFYTRDHLGSVREMTDSNGTIQARYSYDPYGRATQVSGSMASDFQYAGYYEHAGSGLNLTLFRAYDPNTGKWLSRDPMGEGADSTLYSYVYNNPVSLDDPLGLYAQVTVSGNNVNIVLPIDFHQGTPVNGPNGPTIQPGPVDPALVNQIINNIQKSWTGKFGKYNVTTTVTTPSGNCPPNKKNNWNILNNPPPDMPAFAPDGNTVDMPNNRAAAAGHEAGHLMDNGSNPGLPDPPDPNNTGLPNYPGIMGGNNSASPTESNITSIINGTR
jgi:RHS repeat-associated protein